MYIIAYKNAGSNEIFLFFSLDYCVSCNQKKIFLGTKNC